MRTWTLAVSVIAHAAVVVAILVAPIFATADLPDPRRPLTFEAITPIVTPTIAVPSRPQPTPTTTAPSFPMYEPPELPTTDPAIEPRAPQIDSCDACGVGGVPIGGPVGHDIAPPPPIPPPSKQPIPVGGNIRPPTRVHYVEPVYPRFALAGGVQGTVILQATIDEQGSVREVKVLRSVPLLDDAAVQAVSQWRFTPTLLNGTPVPVVMTVTVSFNWRK